MTNEREKTGPRVTWRDVARFTWHYAQPRKAMGFAVVSLMLASVLMDAVVPVYTGRIVDAMTRTGLHRAAVRDVWAAFGMFAFLGVMHYLLRFISINVWNRFAGGTLYAIVNDGLRKVQRFSADWHANAFAGGTVRKITRGMWAFDTYSDTLVISLLPAVTIMIGITVMLGLSLPLVGLVAAAVIAVYCAVSVWVSVKVLSPRFTASAAADTKVGATLADTITGNPTVKSFGAEAREDALFQTVTEAWRTKSLHAWQTGNMADGLRSALRVAMMASMLGTTIILWKAGRATPGDITLVLTTFMIISGYLRDIGQQVSHLQRAVSEMEDVIGFWLREDEVADAPGAQPLKVVRGRHADAIVFNHVGFRYPAGGNWIYRDLNVSIAAGEKLALVGPSGSGKSTFIKLIQRLYNVEEGEIRIDGQDIARVTLESLRRSVALVPQDPVLFHRSLAANIAYGRPDAPMEDIVAAARKAYAHDFIMRLPMGYDTLVGERGVKLSGGERQRVAIARAILADAPVLILDEATSSLDSISEHYIQKALEALTEGRTTITVAHRLSTIQQADRIIVFDDGKIVEQGDHRALMAHASRYRQLYEMQALDIMPEEDAGRAAAE